MTARSAGPGALGFLANRFVAAGLVLAALAGLYALARPGTTIALTAGRLPGRAAARVAVNSAVLACPAPGSGPVTGGSIAVASVPAGPVPGSGQAVVSALTPSGGSAGRPALHDFTAPGHLAVTRIPNAPVPGPKAVTTGTVPTSPARGGVMIQASGAMAQGLEAEQLNQGGQATARCGKPGTDFWFVSPATVKTAFTLYLMNTASQGADVSVSAVTDSGPVLGKTDAGIAVPPHGMVEQSLGSLLHAARVVAVHVTTSSGQVVAAVRETTSTAHPGSWLPVATPPATRLVLPGVPAVPGTRELYVAVPGSAGAQVKITAVTPRGSYQPTGGSGLNVPGSSAFAIALPSLAGIPAAITVTANVPVTAVMAVPGGPPGAAGAFAAGAGPLQQQGVLAASPVGRAGSSELILSAPGRAASVRVTEGGAGQASLAGTAGRIVQIPAGHSVLVRLTAPAGSARQPAVAVVLTPEAGSGPVYAARVASSGSTVESILPVITSPTWIELPGVRESLATVLRDAPHGRRG